MRSCVYIYLLISRVKNEIGRTFAWISRVSKKLLQFLDEPKGNKETSSFLLLQRTWLYVLTFFPWGNNKAGQKCHHILSEYNMDMKEQNGEMISPIAFYFPTWLHGLWRTRLQDGNKDYKGTNRTQMVMFLLHLQSAGLHWSTNLNQMMALASFRFCLESFKPKQIRNNLRELQNKNNIGLCMLVLNDIMGPRWGWLRSQTHTMRLLHDVSV